MEKSMPWIMSMMLYAFFTAIFVVAVVAFVAVLQLHTKVRALSHFCVFCFPSIFPWQILDVRMMGRRISSRP
jgi:hypothetical protein